MKTTIISAILTMLLTFTGCELPLPKEGTPLEQQKGGRIDSIAHGDFEIVLIDECQYIIYKRGKGPIEHTGICRTKETATTLFTLPLPGNIVA